MMGNSMDYFGVVPSVCYFIKSVKKTIYNYQLKSPTIGLKLKSQI